MPVCAPVDDLITRHGGWLPGGIVSRLCMRPGAGFCRTVARPTDFTPSKDCRSFVGPHRSAHFATGLAMRQKAGQLLLQQPVFAGQPRILIQQR